MFNDASASNDENPVEFASSKPDFADKGKQLYTIAGIHVGHIKHKINVATMLDSEKLLWLEAEMDSYFSKGVKEECKPCAPDSLQKSSEIFN